MREREVKMVVPDSLELPALHDAVASRTHIDDKTHRVVLVITLARRTPARSRRGRARRAPARPADVWPWCADRRSWRVGVDVPLGWSGGCGSPLGVWL
jgi:hypothetical protein